MFGDRLWFEKTLQGETLPLVTHFGKGFWSGTGNALWDDSLVGLLENNLWVSWKKHFLHKLDLPTPLLVGSLPSGILDDANFSAGFGQDPLHDGLDVHVDRDMLNIIPQILPNIGQSTCLAPC
jgi:hypothetical protein